MTAAEAGRAGGVSRAKRLTAAERKRIAIQASEARWKKTKQEKPTT